jgi:hypothetical protein
VHLAKSGLNCVPIEKEKEKARGRFSASFCDRERVSDKGMSDTKSYHPVLMHLMSLGFLIVWVVFLSCVVHLVKQFAQGDQREEL